MWPSHAASAPRRCDPRPVDIDLARAHAQRREPRALGDAVQLRPRRADHPVAALEPIGERRRQRRARAAGLHAGRLDELGARGEERLQRAEADAVRADVRVAEAVAAQARVVGLGAHGLAGEVRVGCGGLGAVDREAGVELERHRLVRIAQAADAAERVALGDRRQRHRHARRIVCALRRRGRGRRLRRRGGAPPHRQVLRRRRVDDAQVRIGSAEATAAAASTRPSATTGRRFTGASS